jgi:hypothetical protein
MQIKFSNNQLPNPSPGLPLVHLPIPLLSFRKKKKKKSYAWLVEQLQEGHGPFCIPARLS